MMMSSNNACNHTDFKVCWSVKLQTAAWPSAQLLLTVQKQKFCKWLDCLVFRCFGLGFESGSGRSEGSGPAGSIWAVNALGCRPRRVVSEGWTFLLQGPQLYHVQSILWVRPS